MKYPVLLADPPWTFQGIGTRMHPGYSGKQRAVAHYQTVTQQQILEMPIGEMATDDALLFLWCPNVLLLDGVGTGTARAWGFEPKQIIPWIKVCADGKTLRFGGGSYTRVCSEQMILAVRGRGIDLIRDHGVPGAIVERRGAHSAKPVGAYALIERLVAGPYLEVFARSKREGWDATGAQLDGTIL